MILLFFRALLQTSLVAVNVVSLARGHYLRATAGGFAISALWWFNAHSAGTVDHPWAWLVYATGAGLGTAVGCWVGRR